MNSKELHAAAQRWHTVQDMQRAFGVTGTTIHNWRKTRGMPAFVIPGHKRGTLRFIYKEVMSWATAHGVTVKRVPLLTDLDKRVAAIKAGKIKRGPKLLADVLNGRS